MEVPEEAQLLQQIQTLPEEGNQEPAFFQLLLEEFPEEILAMDPEECKMQ